MVDVGPGRRRTAPSTDTTLAPSGSASGSASRRTPSSQSRRQRSNLIIVGSSPPSSSPPPSSPSAAPAGDQCGSSPLARTEVVSRSWATTAADAGAVRAGRGLSRVSRSTITGCSPAETTFSRWRSPPASSCPRHSSAPGPLVVARDRGAIRTRRRLDQLFPSVPVATAHPERAHGSGRLLPVQPGEAAVPGVFQGQVTRLVDAAPGVEPQ